MPKSTTPRRTRTRTRARARSLPRGAPSATKPPRADPERKKLYASLLDTMRRAKRDEAEGFDAYWEAVRDIVDGELYTIGHYKTAARFLAAEVKLPRRTALRMIRVATYATPAEEQRYGTALLDAALTYIEAQTGGPAKGRLPVHFDAIRVPVERGGKHARIPLTEATVAQLRDAARSLARRRGRAHARSSPAEQTLATALGGVRSLAGVSVHVSDGKVRLGAVPLYALDDLARALRGLALDKPAR